MAKGWDKVEQATAAANEARERAAQNSLPQLFNSAVNPAKGGSPVIVRFLEQGQDVNTFERHEYQVPDKRGGWNRRLFTCLREIGQPCPGCQAGLKLKTRGVYNVIQRNRAVLRKGQDGRALKGPDQKYIIDGFQDQVVIFDVPSTTAEALRQKDGTYHGLMSRDLMLSASNNTFQPWTIEPADIDAGATPLSENDQALAAQKHDLDAFMKPPSFDEATQVVRQYGQNSGATATASVPSGPPAGAPAQGNAAQVGPANGFLQGAQVPAGQSAFGAAQQAVPTTATAAGGPAPAAQQPAAQPGVPGASVPATGAAAVPTGPPTVTAAATPGQVVDPATAQAQMVQQQPPTPPVQPGEQGTGQPVVPVAPTPPA